MKRFLPLLFLFACLLAGCEVNASIDSRPAPSEPDIEYVYRVTFTDLQGAVQSHLVTRDRRMDTNYRRSVAVVRTDYLPAIYAVNDRAIPNQDRCLRVTNFSGERYLISGCWSLQYVDATYERVMDNER